jgi:hypothetical protein
MSFQKEGGLQKEFALRDKCKGQLHMDGKHPHASQTEVSHCEEASLASSTDCCSKRLRLVGEGISARCFGFTAFGSFKLHSLASNLK